MAAIRSSIHEALESNPNVEVETVPRSSSRKAKSPGRRSTASQGTSTDVSTQTGEEDSLLTGVTKRKSTKSLSAAGASASLKRAEPRDLPSFPSHGLANLEASASKAALLAAKNPKNIEIWKPDPSASASAAAVLAKDTKSAPVWKPEMGTNAGKAALLAHHDAASFTPVPPSQSAADASRNAMSAATLAHTPSTKVKKVVEEPRTPAFDIERVSRMARENAEKGISNAVPPKTQSVEDRNKSDILRAATISMQKKPVTPMTSPTGQPPASFYTHLPTSTKQIAPVQPSQGNSRNSMLAANLAHSQEPKQSSSSSQGKPRPFYPNLEEAARKAAAERLARLEAEHQNARNGLYSSNSIRAAQSSTDVDKQRSRKIQGEMANLQQRVAEVDKQKQMKDQLSLLAAAERNVKKQMENMDDRVAEDQGRVPKRVQAAWDAKAKEMSEQYEKKRQAEAETRKGMVDLGGGKWIAQEEIDRIARGNVQPILDEINAKAEAERARQEKLRLEREEAERVKRETAAKNLAEKNERKAARAVEKDEERRKRAEEKERERLRKEEERKEKLRLKETPQTTTTQEVAVGGVAPATVLDIGQTHDITSHEHDADSPISPVSPITPVEHSTERDSEIRSAVPVSSQGDDDTAVSEGKKEKNWFSSMGRRLSRKDKHEMSGTAPTATTPTSSSAPRKLTKDSISGPIPLQEDQHNPFETSAGNEEAIVNDQHEESVASTSAPAFSNDDAISIDSDDIDRDEHARDSSIRNVAMAGTQKQYLEYGTLAGNAVQALRNPVKENASDISLVKGDHPFDDYTAHNTGLSPPHVPNTVDNSSTMHNHSSTVAEERPTTGAPLINKEEERATTGVTGAPMTSATYVPGEVHDGPEYPEHAANDDDHSSVSSMNSENDFKGDNISDYENDQKSRSSGITSMLMKPFSAFGLGGGSGSGSTAKKEETTHDTTLNTHDTAESPVTATTSSTTQKETPPTFSHDNTATDVNTISPSSGTAGNVVTGRDDLVSSHTPEPESEWKYGLEPEGEGTRLKHPISGFGVGGEGIHDNNNNNNTYRDSTTLGHHNNEDASVGKTGVEGDTASRPGTGTGTGEGVSSKFKELW